jgi:hypothetical protein
VRRLASNGITLDARSSNITRLFFRQEFDEELDLFIYEIFRVNNTNSITGPGPLIDGLYKILWAMVRAENFFRKRPTEGFDAWLASLGAFDISDCIDDMLDEIKRGFSVTRTFVNSGDRADAGNLTPTIVSLSLKIGMSLDDLNELSTQALVDIMHKYAAQGENEPQKRMATPKEAFEYFRGRG